MINPGKCAIAYINWHLTTYNEPATYEDVVSKLSEIDVSSWDADSLLESLKHKGKIDFAVNTTWRYCIPGKGESNGNDINMQISDSYCTIDRDWLGSRSRVGQYMRSIYPHFFSQNKS